MVVDLDAIPYVPAHHLDTTDNYYPQPAEIIVMHSMESVPRSGVATNWARSLAAPTGSDSFAHYQTDPTNIVRSAPLTARCPHVGGGNVVRGLRTLGIEQAGNSAALKNSAGQVVKPPMTRQEWIDAGTLNTAGPLVAALVAAGHGGPRWLTDADLKKPGARGITGHNEMRLAFGGTTHTDPGEAYPRDLLIGYLTAPQPEPPEEIPVADIIIFAASSAEFPPTPEGKPGALWFLSDGGLKRIKDPAQVGALKSMEADGLEVIEVGGDKTFFYDMLTGA